MNILYISICFNIILIVVLEFRIYLRQTAMLMIKLIGLDVPLCGSLYNLISYIIFDPEEMVVLKNNNSCRSAEERIE